MNWSEESESSAAAYLSPCSCMFRIRLEAQYVGQEVSYPQAAPLLDCQSSSTELDTAAVVWNQRHHTLTPSSNYRVDIPVSVDALSEDFGRVLARPSYYGTWPGTQPAPAPCSLGNNYASLQVQQLPVSVSTFPPDAPSSPPVPSNNGQFLSPCPPGYQGATFDIRNTASTATTAAVNTIPYRQPPSKAVSRIACPGTLERSSSSSSPCPSFAATIASLITLLTAQSSHPSSPSSDIQHALVDIFSSPVPSPAPSFSNSSPHTLPTAIRRPVQPRSSDRLTRKTRSTAKPKQTLLCSSTSSDSASIPGPNPFKCEECGFVQKTKRAVDMQRHIDTHTKTNLRKVWYCCGFPRPSTGQYPIDSEEFAGGCGQRFRRKDSLQKHFRLSKKSCVGDPHAPWHPGNAI